MNIHDIANQLRQPLPKKERDLITLRNKVFESLDGDYNSEHFVYTKELISKINLHIAMKKSDKYNFRMFVVAIISIILSIVAILISIVGLYQ